MTEDQFSSYHPPLPPTSEDDLISWLCLLRSRRVGIVTFFRMMDEHGSAQAALEALPDVARQAGVQGYVRCSRDAAEAELQRGALRGAQLVAMGTAEYPRALLDIADPPPLIWIKGRAEILNRPMVALVGARNASSLGTRMTRSLAAGLGEAGYVVVSGLARGIDTVAHLAAQPTGTLAVQAGGVDVIYPAENTQLAEEIGIEGLRISEQPMGLVPQARHFPRRNRLISGLAQAVVVVEAAAKSGSLITARNALDQGRDVLAVPGHPFDARASGCNMLLRDGATLVRNVDDVIEALSPALFPAPKVPTPDLDKGYTPAPPAAARSALPNPAPGRATAKHTPLREAADLHAQILARLGPSPMAEDQLIRDVGATAARVTPALLDLEMDGQIERQPGGLLARAGRPH